MICNHLSISLVVQMRRLLRRLKFLIALVCVTLRLLIFSDQIKQTTQLNVTKRPWVPLCQICEIPLSHNCRFLWQHLILHKCSLNLRLRFPDMPETIKFFKMKTRKQTESFASTNRLHQQTISSSLIGESLVITCSLSWFKKFQCTVEPLVLKNVYFNVQ